MADESFARIEAIANENRAALATVLTELRAIRQVAEANAERLDRVERAAKANTEMFSRVRGALVTPRRQFRVEAKASTTDEVIRAWLEKVEFGN
jgi:hypothetical protein